ncbi:MAG: single-stranded DNA-binding protein [Gammaproteobacteria bacterium]|nr:single-stranded DNA-binding protein [Gammaproteobacteria bacterium]
MSRGVNKVILVGTLGADPELRQTNSGSSVCNMRIATNDWRRDSATNERVETTEWHNIVLFKRLAEVAERYLKKGSQVYIEGKLRTRKWQDRDGNNRYSTEVIANDMQLLGARGSGGGSYASENQGGGNYMPENSKPSGNSPGSGGAPTGDDADFDDDIPF